jgi:hypothetical protein
VEDKAYAQAFAETLCTHADQFDLGGLAELAKDDGNAPALISAETYQDRGANFRAGAGAVIILTGGVQLYVTINAYTPAGGR